MTLAEIKEAYDQCMKEFGEEFFSYPWSNQDFYAGWLAQTFHFVKRSTRLLSFAAGSADLDEELLHQRFAAHLGEETGHERMAERDLKSMGYDVHQMPWFTATKEFYDIQFDVAYSKGPSATMGFLLFLEGIASCHGPELLKKVSSFGPEATLFLKVHAEEDQDHIDSAFSLVESLPKEKLPGVYENLMVARRTYKAILDKVQESLHVEAA